jgi:hypothetical protein
VITGLVVTKKLLCPRVDTVTLVAWLAWVRRLVLGLLWLCSQLVELGAVVVAEEARAAWVAVVELAAWVL